MRPVSCPPAPIVEPLVPAPSPEEVFLRLCGRPHCLFLDSAMEDSRLGRYSFVTADPFDWLEVTPEGPDALAELARRLAAFPAKPAAGLPPFQGGAAGLLSYDLGRQLERLPKPRFDEFGVPAVALGFYDVAVAFDHAEGRAWIISHGFPEQDEAPRLRRAKERLAQFRKWITAPVAESASFANTVTEAASFGGEQAARPTGGKQAACPTGADLAPQFPVGPPDGLTSNFTEAAYLAAVERAIEYVRAGDIFQVNLAQRLLFPARDDAVSLYLRLRRRNPAPFAGYFDLGPFQIASASPERFLRVAGGTVEARPIKGTRPRTSQPEADLFAGAELLASEKDRAENVMIVDLLRNDLGRICRTGSIAVPGIFETQSFTNVHHLVSTITGRLDDAGRVFDLLEAGFPGGSITGTPKIRAMEIINELESVRRSVYCGAFLWIDRGGNMDSNICIRTLVKDNGRIHCWGGGGVVADSVGEQEYQESLDKISLFMDALKNLS